MYLSGFLSSFLMKYINAKIGKKVSLNVHNFMLCLWTRMNLSMPEKTWKSIFFSTKHLFSLTHLSSGQILHLWSFLHWIHRKRRQFIIFQSQSTEKEKKDLAFQDSYLPVFLHSLKLGKSFPYFMIRGCQWLNQLLNQSFTKKRLWN